MSCYKIGAQILPGFNEIGAQILPWFNEIGATKSVNLQDFAYNLHDNSFEGKKSGIRHSKEERKGMIETFIKRYQNNNNQDFSSLKTHTQGGGTEIQQNSFVCP